LGIVRSAVGQLALYSFPHLTAAGARHAAATRLGGVSQGAFAALNVGFSTDDDAANVEANRRSLYAALGTEAGDVVTSHQVHGVNVASIGEAGRGRGAMSAGNTIPATDALITDRPHLFLFLRFADCVPVLFCDPVHGAVGVAHAGWKGTAADIVGTTVKAMAQAFGARPSDLLAAVGPAIGSCHYTVQDDVAGRIRSALPFAHEVLTKTGEGYALDLPNANRRLLVEHGVSERNIAMSGLCTACHTDEFYSHRAEKGKTGRFGVLIGWVGHGQ
jgi:YfiH family protein